MADFWHGKRVFVTGANGFLGSHLTKLLIARGVKPYVLIYEENPGGLFDTEGLADQCTVIRGDVRDFALIDNLVRTEKIDVIYHLAAQAIVDQAHEDPLETFDVNIKGTWNILDAARRSGTTTRVVIASSDKAYGEQETLPYVEDVHALKGKYPYEVSKVCGDILASSFFATFGLAVAITRCANLYGPGDLKMNRLIPRTIAQLYAGQPPIIRDTGASLRDYLYVEDAAEAYLMLGEKLEKPLYGEAFNFATNVPISVTDAIKTISSVMQSRIEPTVVVTHGMEIRNQFASYDKAKRLLSWEPRHDFAAGLAKTVPWYVAHLEKAGATNREGVLHG